MTYRKFSYADYTIRAFSQGVPLGVRVRDPQLRLRVGPVSRPEKRYLGDAVSVSFDGFQLCLECEAPPCKIYLDPYVFKALEDYVGEVKAWAKEVRS